MSFTPSSKRRTLFLASASAGLTLLLLANGLGLADTSRAASAKAKRGDALFHQQCVTCHNKQAGDTTPFGPPNLHGIFRPNSPLNITPAQAEATIKQGKGAMPSFGSTLSSSQISDLIAYLKTQ